MLTYYLLTFAQRINPSEVGISDNDAETVLSNTLNLFYFLAGAVAVIVLIIGGIIYSASAGNAASITRAKNMIIYSVVGLVVVFAAFMITNFVRGAF